MGEHVQQAYTCTSLGQGAVRTKLVGWRGRGEGDLKLSFGQGLPPLVKGQCSINSNDPCNKQSCSLAVLSPLASKYFPKWNPQTPSLQNGLLETHRYFPGASNWNTSGTKLEHNWNTSGTPTAEVNTTGTQLEHLPQTCKWNTSGIQVGHKWNTTGTCITPDYPI